MVSLIAGHRFELTPTGRRCTAFSTSKAEICMQSWLDIRKACDADVDGPHGYAHIGCLNAAELEQIKAEVKREEADVWQAVIDAASSGSR